MYILIGELQEDDYRLSQNMVRAWSSFINTGSPATGDFVDWETVNLEHKYMNISGGLAGMCYDKTLKERMDLWDDLMNEHESTTSEAPVTSIKTSTGTTPNTSTKITTTKASIGLALFVNFLNWNFDFIGFFLMF